MKPILSILCGAYIICAYALIPTLEQLMVLQGGWWILLASSVIIPALVAPCVSFLWFFVCIESHEVTGTLYACALGVLLGAFSAIGFGHWILGMMAAPFILCFAYLHVDEIPTCKHVNNQI